MGFWGDLWSSIKRPFTSVYDNVIKPVANTVSNIYDRVKDYIPAPFRAPLDSIQATGRNIGNVIGTARSAMDAVGLKDGGQVLKEHMARDEGPRKKFYQA